MKHSQAHSHNYFVRSALKEINLLRKHFGISGVGDDVSMTREMSPRNITEFFREYFAAVRPDKLSYDKILPKPELTKLRALYVGHPDANILLNFIVRHCLYVDQIVVIDPFTTLPHDDIKARPQIWAQTILDRAICLCALEEWVKEGIVLIIPSIIYYHPLIEQQVHAKYANKGMQEAEKHRAVFEKQMLIKLLVDEDPSVRESLLDVLDSMGRSFAPEERKSLLEEAELYESQNPIRFRLPSSYYQRHFKGDENYSQIFSQSLGMPLFLGPSLSEEINAFLVFENPYSYKILAATVDASSENTASLQQLAIAFQTLDFPFLNNVPLNKALDLRKQQYLHSFRLYLRDLWNTTQENKNNITMDEKIMEFMDRLKAEYGDVTREWQQIRNELRLQAATSGAVVGLSVVAAGSFSITFGALAGVAAGVIKENISGYTKISEKAQKTQEKPIFVFLTLQK